MLALMVCGFDATTRSPDLMLDAEAAVRLKRQESPEDQRTMELPAAQILVADDAVANRKLFIATQDGKVLCYGEK